MRDIRIFCCSCERLQEVIQTDGDGSVDVQGDRCDKCVESQKVKKGFKKSPKLSVVVNDSKGFDKLMADRKVQNQPKKRAKR